MNPGKYGVNMGLKNKYGVNMGLKNMSDLRAMFYKDHVQCDLY